MRRAGGDLLTLAAAALLLAGAEAAARRAEPRGDPLDQVGRLLRADAALGWRQRENLRGELMSVPVETDAAGRRQPARDEAGVRERILVLGPSSAFGWGVAEPQTYSRRLEATLRPRLPGLSVVNAGQIGFSSWQGLRLYEAERAGPPLRALVVAYGANDVDRYRFFFSDRRSDAEALAAPRQAAVVAASNLVRRSAGLRWLARRAASWRGGRSCQPDGARPGEAPAVPSLRVPPEDFERNLTRFAAAGRADGAVVVLLTTPFLFAHASREEADAAQALYRRSAEEAAAGRCQEARAAFQLARQAEPARLARDLDAYNAAAKRVAARAGLPLVDAERLLGRDRALFVDPIHPSAEGHRRIAAALADALKTLHGGRT